MKSENKPQIYTDKNIKRRGAESAEKDKRKKKKEKRLKIKGV